MILDHLTQWRQYAAISPYFAQAFGFLEKVNGNIALGRHDIAGEDVFAIVQKHSTKPVNGLQYEVHRRYIDVHYVHRGREVVYWAPLRFLTNVVKPFSTESDAALYGLVPEGVSLSVREGHFVALFPGDGHIPSCAWDQAAEVLKVVVKVAV